MKVNLSNVKRIGLVIVSYKWKGVKKPTKVITFNSRLQVFYSYKEATLFELAIINKLREIEPKEIHECYYVSLEPSPPPEDLDFKGLYYCPYCGQLNFVSVDNTTGYKVCPICHCSMNDYHFMNYNNLWHNDKKQGNTGKKIKRRKRTNAQEDNKENHK